MLADALSVHLICLRELCGMLAGCDGIVNMWDGENKKRLCQVSSIAAPHSVNDVRRAVKHAC